MKADIAGSILLVVLDYKKWRKYNAEKYKKEQKKKSR